MKFWNWAEDVHTAVDQQKRIKSAKSAETTPNSIDRKK